MGAWQIVGWAALAVVTFVRVALIIVVIAAAVAIVRAVLRAKPAAPHTPD